MKRIKNIFICLLIILSLINTIACVPYKYKGERADLYTVAVNTFFRAKGWDNSNPEVVHDPYLKVIETDDYGRVLFCYNERLSYYEKEHQYDEEYEKYYYACIIMQKSSDGFVYYYEDVCIEGYLIEDENSFKNEIYSEAIKKDFTNLKQLNDWGKEFNEEKCVKKPITTKKSSVLDIKDKTFEEITRKYATFLGDKGDDVIYRYEVYSTSDFYGRELYYVWGISRDVYGEGISPTSTAQYFHFAIIFNPDGSYNQETCIVEITDLVNFNAEIKQLKTANQWNEPY